MSKDLKHVKQGMAVLMTCLVKTLDEIDPTAKDKFIARIDESYGMLRDNPSQYGLDELELISWTRQLITGFSVNSGQGDPFFS